MSDRRLSRLFMPPPFVEVKRRRLLVFSPLPACNFYLTSCVQLKRLLTGLFWNEHVQKKRCFSYLYITITLQSNWTAVISGLKLLLLIGLRSIKSWNVDRSQRWMSWTKKKIIVSSHKGTRNVLFCLVFRIIQLNSQARWRLTTILFNSPTSTQDWIPSVTSNREERVE